tara:strand:- start:614 stop:1108 length:495 start_codon:yes stop_codon:yes gene_type:complete
MSSKLPDMNKLMKEIEEEQKDSLFIFNSGMDTYKNWLKAHNIQNFQVNYSGYADSGEVEEVSINFTKDGNTKDSIPPEYLSFERDHYSKESKEGTRWRDNKNESKRTFEDILSDLSYNILSLMYGGWEINDGSSGTIRWNSTENKIKVEHGWNIQTTEEERASI